MLLQASNISKTFVTSGNEVRALDDVSIQVDVGERVGLIGESGSGKTTLGNIVIGLEAADSGNVEFEGVGVDATLQPRKRPAQVRNAFLNMQMVFQNPQQTFSDRMRIGTAVMEGIAYRDDTLTRSQQHQRMLESLEQVELPASYAQKYAWELSGGECQRASIARAIVGNPKLLVCDEPTSALDVTVQAQVIRLLARLCDDRGMACLFISHDLMLVRSFCSRAYVMQSGHIVEQGSCNQLFDDPQNHYTKRLISSLMTI